MLPYCHVACILHCYFLANIPNCQVGEECGWSRWACYILPYIATYCYIAIHFHILPYCLHIAPLVLSKHTKLPNREVDCGWSRWAADVNERRDGIKGMEISFLIFCLQRLPDIAKQKWFKKQNKNERENIYTERKNEKGKSGVSKKCQVYFSQSYTQILND